MNALNILLALLVLGAVVCRLAHLSPGKSLAYNAWVSAHALIGAGALGYVYASLAGREAVLSTSALYCGLAMMLLVQWRRRQGER